jgi:LPXTG-motif cell wall-anchored protein
MLRPLAGGLLLVAAGTAAGDPARPAGVAAWVEGRLAEVVRDVEPTLRRWGYPAVAAVVALDLTGIPMPAVAVMVAATVAAKDGRLSLPAVAALSFAAAAVGSQLGYAVGRRAGRPLLARLPLAPERVKRVERAYERWGAWIVVLAPWSDGLRQLNGLTAGLLGLPWRKFTAASLLGCALWMAGWIGGTLLLDEHLAAVVALARAGAPWLLAAAALGLAAAGALLVRRRRKEPQAAPRR